LKCLEKEPGQRYASAQDLAEDLRRFQAGEPIVARPIGPVGRTVKWARRRPVVASLLAGLVLAGVGLLGTTVWALNERANAQTALERVSNEKEETNKALVKLGITCADLGNLQQLQGNTTAEKIYEEAIRVWTKLHADFPHETLYLFNLERVYTSLGRSYL